MLRWLEPVFTVIALFFWGLALALWLLAIPIAVVLVALAMAKLFSL